MSFFRRLNPGIRRSQVITTFGPGSIIDLQHTSAMIAGLGFWPDDSPVIHEPALEKFLQVSEFRTPATGRGDDVPAVIFPEWYVCPQCYRLAPYRFYTMAGTHRRGSPLRCPGCSRRVYPARLIVACRHGHIDDFPWVEWVHTRIGNPVCRRPMLYLRPLGFTSALADLFLKCEACGASTTMAGATQTSNLSFLGCTGRRPWLMDNISCQAEVVPLQRGASNVYFGVHASTISIPPWSRSIFRKLDRHWNYLRGIHDDNVLRVLLETMEIPQRMGLGLDETIQAIRQRQAYERGEAVGLNETGLRYNECMALHHGTSEPDSDAEFTATPTHIDSRLQPFFQRVVLVERLREVRVLLGFNRVEPPDPGSRMATTLSPLAIPRPDWLPAVEVRGEGIYLQLDESRLEGWSINPAVARRAAILNTTYLGMCERRGWQPERQITPRFLLAHSLAHALIRQLSLESGYASASLRERLYIFEPEPDLGRSGVAGILIYTATPDSEGSLGGLVRQGQPDRLADTVLSAIEEASWCSSDPLCIESLGQGLDATSLAACHACLLTSETSCEQFNRFLDRAMLTGTLENPAVGYCGQLLEN